ncbi:OmpA family protein [Pseudotenacibaculum sp. MALMAid0570]|uniref:OmpA family protein n=1 Tax=Pseudotenacibaculum sp. MALMAid0570 TaxID=3143938 RepID=UPI0032E00C6E
MRRILLASLFAFISIHLSAQFTTDQYTYKKSINLRNSNSWAIGGGFSNFIMHGDLRSIGTGNQGNFWNFGGYLYVDKMFNPLLGLEFKVNYNKISGGAQYFSDIYEVLYVDNTNITNNLFFEGRAYGAELNLIFSFSNLYEHLTRKWHVSGYFGMGYHQYNSSLYERNPDGSRDLLVDFGFNPARNSIRQASSIYLTAQLGIKYRVSKRVDIEFRPSWYFNYEDHLDAAISNKQDWETFFVNHLGVTIKLGKEKVFTIWGEDDLKDSIGSPGIQLVDTDKDGVIDQLDKEPNTPEGVMVYANGVSVDSDGDKIPDYKDECRFEPGPENNNGCPVLGDRDKDGIPDRKDKCIDVKGLERYEGCPDNESLKLTEVVEVLNYSKNIYFDTASNEIKSANYYTMLDEVANIMLKNPNVSFSVSGYTDDRGEENYNQKLSERRANEARLYLIARGVEEDRISSAGYGELNPKYDNSTSQGRQLNRRVEIKSVGPYEKKTKVIIDRKN